MNRLFVLISMVALRISALDAQTNLQLLAQMPYDSATLAGCWNHVDAAGNEYALVGTSRGLSIVNLNEPTAPYELFSVPAAVNNWREVKTWGGYAYVSTEAANSGITIVDLNHLPDSITYKLWRGDSAHMDMVLSAHAVAATDGYLYLFGSKPLCNGVVICDLTDPWNPSIKGSYCAWPGHDGYVRNDTLWLSEVYQGQFTVLDVRDKSNPIAIVTQSTPAEFNHNTWLSDDGRTVFTTDERANAPLASFDVSDLGNITLLDTYYPSQAPSQEVHNVRVLNDFLINPSYGGQLTIVDAHRPDNLIEVAWAKLGSSLVWDADPFLPSGVIFATAKNEGLFIYKPTYQRACYLDGVVTDSVTQAPLLRAAVRIVSTLAIDSTNVLGQYKSGYHIPGIWTVEVSHPGYITKTIEMVPLTEGQTTIRNVALAPLPSGTSVTTDLARIRVFPTTFQTEFRITADQIDQALYAELTDLRGNLVYSCKVQTGTQTVTLGSILAVGHYLLTIRSDRGVLAVHRLMKI
jgi:choice-of-anchor B domain-containing protein